MKQRANRKRLSAYAGGNTHVVTFRSSGGKRVYCYVTGWHEAKLDNVQFNRRMKQWGMQ